MQRVHEALGALQLLACEGDKMRDGCAASPVSSTLPSTHREYLDRSSLAPALTLVDSDVGHCDHADVVRHAEARGVAHGVANLNFAASHVDGSLSPDILGEARYRGDDGADKGYADRAWTQGAVLLYGFGLDHRFHHVQSRSMVRGCTGGGKHSGGRNERRYSGYPDRVAHMLDSFGRPPRCFFSFLLSSFVDASRRGECRRTLEAAVAGHCSVSLLSLSVEAPEERGGIDSG